MVFEEKDMFRDVKIGAYLLPMIFSLPKRHVYIILIWIPIFPAIPILKSLIAFAILNPYNTLILVRKCDGRGGNTERGKPQYQTWDFDLNG